jgi:NhaP-type Na+/H+ and K+/H+ antiporter
VVGKRIVIASWATLGVYTLVAVPFSLGLNAFEVPAVVVSLGLFFVSLPIWIYAFGLALVRSTRGDDIVVSSWVFLTGSAPSDVRKHLLWATFASVVICIATAFANPFGVLVPMLQLGFAALWGARYGTFPARRVKASPGIAKGARR